MKEKLLKNKWLIATIALAVIAVAAIVVAIVLGVSGASSNDNDRVFGVGEEGVYYYEVVDGKVILTLRDGTFTLSGKINKTGVYSVDGSNISLDFYKDEDGTASATLNGDALSFVYEDANLSFLKETEYTVSFDVNGGSEISAVKVTNGKTAGKPAADPVKANSVFIGWYADEALTIPFAFDEVAVKSDLTVYAKWATKVAGVPDYVVSFVLGYDGAEEIDPLTTVSGVAYGMPTPKRQGYTFGGWYVSMYEDGDKLSYKYEDGTAFTADTTLYAVWYDDSSAKLDAPAVSVSASTISWDAVSGASSYKLTVIAPDGVAVIENETVTGTSKEFKFADLGAGEYKISVVAVAGNAEKNSDAADRYFANKTLAKVSEFSVENGILVFGAVENAEKYTVSIVCGNKGHNHANFDNGSSTTYYIANCQMQEGGILITVTASAKGYASSTSNVFAYDKTLGAVENLKYDASADKFVWNAVSGAANYKVTVTVGASDYVFNNGTATSFSIAAYTGDVKVSVVPAAEGFNSPAAASASCKKTAPAAPGSVSVSGNVISWSAVEGDGISYEVLIGNQSTKTSETSLNISTASLGLTQGQIYSVCIKAINAKGESSSLSETVELGYFAMGEDLVYKQNTVYWTPVVGADQYQVRVNGGEIDVITGKNSAKVTLTKEGANLIEVRYVYESTFSEWAAITVNAYAVEYDTRTAATGVLTVEYVAVGDLLTLPAEGFSLEGYDFTGWYNAPKGSLGNGKLYGEGSVFSGNAYTVVYAEWTPKTYNATLRVDGLGFTVTNIVDGVKEPITYTKDFKLTVPTAQNTGMYFFAGWYTGPAGTGIQITDEEGHSLVPYEYTRDITLYPYYSTNALAFTLQDDGTYAVSKGQSIASVTTLKIPVSYNEIPVTVILENAFSGCTTITKIEIPDTIRLVGTGAFNGCTKLEHIDVYVAKPDEAGQYETSYSSDNGVLLREDMNTTWLEFFPRAMTGEYTIPSSVENILPKAFYWSKISKITIPKSINSIPEYAFYQCDFTEVVFEGGRTTPVELVKNSFYYCDDITTLTLPAMISAELSALKTMLNTFTKLTSIEIEEGGTQFASVGGIVTNAEKTEFIYCPRGYAGDLSIPLGITSIYEYAFQYCDYITSVTIPVWVTNVGKYAFQYCDGIKTVTIEGSRSEDLAIGEEAFWCLYELESVTFEGNGTDELDEGQITLGKLAFYGSSSCKLETVTIGDGVNLASISQQAFQTQAKLKTFTISDKAYVGSIDTKAFEKCVSLESFRVPASVTNIAANAFNGCVRLSSLEFATKEGESALTMEELAFNGCSSISTVELPDRLTSFDASAFEGCSSLKAITVTGTNESYVNDDNGILYAKNVDENDNVVFTELLFYPKGLVKDNGGIINNLPETLVIIGGSAFSDNAYLTAVVIPAGVTSIGTSAFANCENLESVTFSSVATADGEPMTLEIGATAFQNCKSLTDEFRLPAHTSSIGNGAFQGCTFTSFIIPEGVTYIGMAAFFGSETLESVIFKCTGDLVIADGSNNKEDKGGAFSNCTALRSVAFPAGLTELGKYTFYKSPNLESVTFGTVTENNGVYTTDSKLTRIGNRAFQDCVLLETIVIPKTVTAIGEYAFAATEKVTSANFGPGSLKNLIFEKGGTETLNFGGNIFQYQPIEVLNLPERALIPMPSALQLKVSGKAVKDSNGTTLYTAPTTALTAEVTTLTNMFKGCANLAAINIESDDAVTGLYASLDGVLYNADMTVLIYCPVANVGAVSEGVPTYELVIPTSVELVLTNAIANCTELTTVTFAEFDKSDAKYATQLLTIGNYTNSSGSADKYMAIGGASSNISKINLPSHLKKISYNAFIMGSKSADLEPMEINFNLDAKNVEIGKYGFYYSTVKTLALPGIKSLGDYTFAKCAQLESISFVSLASTIKKLPNYMFQTATSLKSFTIPAQITELGTNVFDGCTSITEIAIPETVTKLGNCAFQASGLTSVTLHSKLAFTSLTTSQYLFKNCKSLESVYFAPKADGSFNVTMIPNYFFDGCESLTTVNLNDFIGKITKVGKSSFKGTNLPEIDFTKFTALTAVDTQSFSNMPNITRVDLSKTKLAKISTAWNNLPNLVEFIFPETMNVDIDSGSFTNDTSLARVYLTKTYEAAWLANINTRIIQKSNVPVDIIIPEDNPYFTIDEFGVVYDLDMQTIYFVSPTADLTGYVIPEDILQIGAYAFAHNKSLTHLVIPEGVTKIDKNAFYYSSISSLVISSTVQSIGNYAFQHAALETVTFTDTLALPSQLTTLGDSVFGYTNLVSVVLPDALETIGNHLFSECDDLKSITTGASMTTIPNGIASYANGLEEINMQEGIETIRWILSSYSYKSGYGPNKVTALYIPASVKTIESDAFCDFSSLKTVVFAEGSQLETITKHAFENCTSLKSIVGLPASLTTIGEAAFKNCTSLKSIDLSATAVTEMLKETFYNTKSLESALLPQSLTSIGEYAFYNSGIKNLAVPATVTAFGNSAFENSALETVTFPKASILTTLGELLNGSKENISNVFRGTKSLETVVLPNTLVSIGHGAFADSSVKTVTLADEEIAPVIETIGKSAFESCENLTGFAYLDKVTEIGEKAFFRCKNLETTVVPEGVSSIGAMAFAFCEKLDTAYIPASLMTLGGNPYAGIELSKLSISPENKNFVLETDESGVTALKSSDGKITYAVFGLTGAYTYDSENMAPGALAGTAITHLTVSPSLVAIGDYMFMNCTELVEVTMSEGLETIGQYAFYGTALTTVAIPAGTEEIGDAAFMNCASIDNIVMPKTVVTIGNYVFANCATLSSFEFESFAEGESVKKVEMGTHFFYNCPNITEVILPDKLNTTDADKVASGSSYTNDIPSYMFAGTGIVNAVIEKNGISFYFFTRGVFANCKNLVSVYFEEIPDNSVTSYGFCNPTFFEGCDNLEVIYVDAIDAFAYSVGAMHKMHGVIHVKNSVNDETTKALSASAYLERVYNEEFELHFDQDSYTDLVNYLAKTDNPWNFKIYDKDGNRLYCSERDGSVAYVEDADGNVIWGEKPAN